MSRMPSPAVNAPTPAGDRRTASTGPGEETLARIHARIQARLARDTADEVGAAHAASIRP